MIGAALFASKRAGSLFWRGVLGMYGVAFAINATIAANDSIDPPSSYFMPYSIIIPDFCVGDDPQIRYTRAIHKPFTGQFSTRYEAVDRETFPLVLYSSAWFSYKPKALSTVVVLLSDFMGRDPALSPGSYVAVVEWTMRRRWHSDAQIVRASNPFTVTDCKR